MANKTTVIVSYRISSIKHIDYIIMIEDGRIIEEVNHDNLLSKNDEYYEIYQKQLIEE